MSTIWAIVMFVISCIPVIGQIIAAIMAVLDGLFALFTWLFGGNAQTISQALLSLFYLAEVCTNIGDGSISFGDFTSGLADPDMGLVGGNTFLLRAPFEGALIETSFGNDDNLKKSSVKEPCPASTGTIRRTSSPSIFTSEGHERSADLHHLEHREVLQQQHRDRISSDAQDQRHRADAGPGQLHHRLGGVRRRRWVALLDPHPRRYRTRGEWMFQARLHISWTSCRSR